MAALTNERRQQLRKAISELEGLSAENKTALLDLLGRVLKIWVKKKIQLIVF